jgi:hypothetical protein
VNPTGVREFYLVLDHEGAIIAYQEKNEPWAGALAFSSEELARNFIDTSHLEADEIVAIDTEDDSNLGNLIASLKRRPIRYLLLDLDYRSGKCRQIDFEGNALAGVRERQITPPGETDR